MRVISQDRVKELLNYDQYTKSNRHKCFWLWRNQDDHLYIKITFDKERFNQNPELLER